ncbi:MAG: carboxypeptidase-like regulatory domain-containing protein [Pyrinomonadaceae bacterium]
MPRIKKRKIVNAVIFLLAAHCLLFIAHAQNTGGVKGKVRNMRGDDIAGATVTARQASKDVRSVKSGGKGEFVLSGLESGIYNIVFDAKGYSSGIKYNVEVEQNKTVDLGSRLILQIDRGTQVIVQGSVFFKDGTSVTAAEVKVERVNADGSTKKLSTIFTNIYGEFVFRQPEGSGKYRMTAKYRDSTAVKEIEVSSAAIYRLAISLEISRQEK